MLLNVQHIVSFWLMQELAELVDGLNGCAKVAGVWCLVAWNFSDNVNCTYSGGQKTLDQT